VFIRLGAPFMRIAYDRAPTSEPNPSPKPPNHSHPTVYAVVMRRMLLNFQLYDCSVGYRTDNLPGVLDSYGTEVLQLASLLLCFPR
jgi:hypothetical protein